MKSTMCKLFIATLLCVCGLSQHAFATATDFDNDGVPNYADNCVNVSNSDQADLDSNGIGDACEGVGDVRADVNEDGQVNFQDLAILKENFFGNPTPPDTQGVDCRLDQPVLLSPSGNTPSGSVDSLSWQHNPCAAFYSVSIRDTVTNDAASSSIFESQIPDRCSFDSVSGYYVCENNFMLPLIINRNYEWCLLAKSTDSVGGALFDTGPRQCLQFRLQ